MQKYSALSPAQIEQFLAKGFIVIHDAFDPALCKRRVERAWMRMGYDPADPKTWAKSRVTMPNFEFIEARDFSPVVWRTACELMGGEERVLRPCTFSDGFIVNLSGGDDRPWEPPTVAVKGWHKDGNFFRHFLDSPEQGLLTLVLWSDLESRGGGTFVAQDSVAPVARYFATRPEGVLPNEIPFRTLVEQCSSFFEVTGRACDVVLLHPYVLHASSQNHLRKPRFLTNPPFKLVEPMNFNRADPSDFSLVELSVLRALGVERLDFQPTRPRERVDTTRV